MKGIRADMVHAHQEEDKDNFYLQPHVTERLVDCVALPLLHLENVGDQLDGCKVSRMREAKENAKNKSSSH